MAKSRGKKIVMIGIDGNKITIQNPQKILNDWIFEAFNDYDKITRKQFPSQIADAVARCPANIYGGADDTFNHVNIEVQKSIKGLKKEDLHAEIVQAAQHLAHMRSLLLRVEYAMSAVLSGKHQNALSGAEAKHKESDYEKAKAEIKQKWLSERETIIAKRGGKAKFYSDMQKQHQIKRKDENGMEIDVDLIRDLKTIQSWVAGWERSLL